ncbi:MAG: Ig-like domain-containing protein, partial [Planctomycetia bacterium]|nr:Ig-like domain-containing protein [Planctomycetia bacterium]
MKKTPKSNRSRRSSWMKKNLSANRKPTTFHLESLEPRQMLSGISFAAVNLNGDTVESDRFQVTLNDENGTTETQYVTMNIISSSGRVIDPKDISMEGVAPVRASADSGTRVTSILYQMGFGTDYSVTVDNLQDGETLSVFFTVLGDKDGNGLTEKEYYEAFGEAMKSKGLNSQSVKIFKNKYGVDITQNHFDTLWDLNNDGKFTLEEFDVLFSENTITVDLRQTITTSPDIRDLQVNGETPREDGLVAGSELELSGTLSEMDTTHPVWAQVTVGEKTEDVNLTELANSSGSFTWNVADTIALADGDEVKIVLYGGKCETTVDDPSANSWSFTLDATAPAITETEVLTVNDQEAFEGKFYGKYNDDGNLNFEIQFATDLEKDAFLTMLEEEGNGLYIDVVIANASGTPVFTATNYQVTKDRVTKKQDENNYVLSLSISQKDTKLADGEYTLTVTPHDLAGNTVAETTPTLVVDSTAPVAADVATTYTEKTNPGSVTADYYTDGTFSDGSADVTLGFANGEKGTIHYSLDGGENWLSSGDTFVGELTLFPTWQAGTNTIQYYLVDWAGNALGSETEPLTWTCIINTAPVLSDAGNALVANGLTQLEREGAEDVTVTLADQFTNDDQGAMTYSATSSDSRVTATVDENGVLSFTFTALEEDEVSYPTTITVTATDQYGETCTLTFELEYTKDNEAPQAGNVQIEDGSGDRLDSTGWNQTGYDIILAQQGSTATELWLTGTIEDISEIESFTVVWGGSSYAVTNPAEDFTDGVFSYNAANKSFKIDITGITEGGYSLKVYGADEHGNVTTADTAQETTILVDFTAPIATIDSIAMDGKSTTTTVYTNDTTPTVTVVVSDADTDTWVQLWNGATLLGSGQVANGTVSITPTETLAGGSYTLTVQIVDGVGNKGASQECLVVVDTTKPVVGWNSGDFDSEQTGTETGEYYTINSSQKVILELTETNQTGGSWTITRNDAPLEYNADGLELILGTNAFTATYTDAAGNVSEELSFTVILNDVPTPVAGQQVDAVQDDGGDGSYEKTYDLSKWFSNEVGDMRYSVSGGTEGITATTNGNTLTVNFSAWAEDDTKYNDYTFTITATDSYGETATADLVITYTNDNLPPQWGNILVNEQPAKEWNGMPTPILATNSTPLTISAPVKELSGIKELYLAVLKDGNAIPNLEKVNLLDAEASLGIYDPSEQTITLKDIPVEAGTYTLILFGSDELGNSSVKEDGSYKDNASRVDILVDTTEPAVTLVISAEKTLTNTLPKLDLEGMPATGFSESNAIKYEVWAQKGEEIPILYMSGFSTDGNLPELTPLVETLDEGVWIFSIQAIDVAGNISTGEQTTGNSVTVTIDTTPPSAAEWEGDVLSPYAGEAGAYYTEDRSQMVLAAFNEPVTVTIRKGTEEFSYTNNDFIEYGRNEFTVVATDLAGNVSETEFVIHYNAVPVVVTGSELRLPIGEYDNGTVTFILPAYQVRSLFAQADEDVDSLTYTFQINGESVTSELLTSDVFCLTLTGVAESATSLGKISITVTDSYGKTATFTSSDDSYKENLAPGWDSSATLEDGALQVTMSQLFENILYTFDVPVADAETDVSNLTLTSPENSEYSFAWDEDRNVWTCTFKPTNEDFTGTVSLPFTLEDVEYGGNVGERTSNLSISLTVSKVNRAPVRNETSIPAVETKAGEEVTINLANYNKYFTDPDGDPLTVQLVDGGTATLTPVLGQTGQYTFTPSTYGVYTFLIQASDGELSSASATVSIVAAGTASIKDESLDVMAEQTISAGVAT